MERLKSIADRYLLNRTVFKVLLVVTMMVTAVPYLHIAVGGYVKILLVYGYMILAYELLTKQYFALLREKSYYLLLAFCASYMVTAFLNRELNFAANIKALAYMFLFFSLLGMADSDAPAEKLNAEVRLISAAVIVCTFILSGVSIGMYIFSFSGHYMTENGFMYYGMYDNRLWGVYNANTGSTLNSVSILLSVGFLLSGGRKALNIVLNALNLLLQFSCLVLTGSRAALYALIAVLALLAFVLCVRTWLHRRKKLGVRGVLAGVLSSVLLMAVLLGGVDLAKEGLAYLPSLVSNAVTRVEEQAEADVPEDEEESGKTLEKYDLTRLEAVENRAGGVLSGRTDIWQACFAVFKEKPVFGVGRENIPDYAIPHLADAHWASNLKVGGPHNIYLCVLVSSGLVGFVLIGVYTANILIRSLLSVWRSIRTCPVWMLICFLMTVMFCMTELVESRILYQVGIFYVLFWTYSGYMLAFAKQSERERQAARIE